MPAVRTMRKTYTTKDENSNPMCKVEQVVDWNISITLVFIALLISAPFAIIIISNSTSVSLLDFSDLYSAGIASSVLVPMLFIYNYLEYKNAINILELLISQHPIEFSPLSAFFKPLILMKRFKLPLINRLLMAFTVRKKKPALLEEPAKQREWFCVMTICLIFVVSALFALHNTLILVIFAYTFTFILCFSILSTTLIIMILLKLGKVYQSSLFQVAGSVMIGPITLNAIQLYICSTALPLNLHEPRIIVGSMYGAAFAFFVLKLLAWIIVIFETRTLKNQC